MIGEPQAYYIYGVHDAAPFHDLQGLLAKPFAHGLARALVSSVPSGRHSAEPDEPKYLHALRIDVCSRDEGAEHHHRFDNTFR
jgi:hypothetical protein